MELETRSPFGDKPHQVIALPCGFRGCHATSPCGIHEQVVVRLKVDGRELPDFKLGKPAFNELQELHRDSRELFHMLADFALLAESPPEMPSISDMLRNQEQGGF
jgi:hypothetical protein